MIRSADHNLTTGGLLLEMTLKTEIGVAGDEHLVVDRSVRVMTGGATFPHCFMLENKWPPLGGVALSARFMFRG